MFKRLFHKYKYLAYSSHMEQIYPGVYKRVVVWKCTKCDKEQWGKR